MRNQRAFWSRQNGADGGRRLRWWIIGIACLVNVVKGRWLGAVLLRVGRGCRRQLALRRPTGHCRSGHRTDDGPGCGGVVDTSRSGDRRGSRRVVVGYTRGRCRPCTAHSRARRWSASPQAYSEALRDIRAAKSHAVSIDRDTAMMCPQQRRGLQERFRQCGKRI